MAPYGSSMLLVVSWVFSSEEKRFKIGSSTAICKGEIDEKGWWLMTGVEAYFNFLSEVTRKVAKQLKRRVESQGA